MMKVTVNNKGIHTYMVRFHYPHRHRRNYNQSLVYCYITERVNDRVTVLMTGQARCVKPDVFDKTQGRKYAFEHAVNSFTQNKDVRKAFWNEFLRTHKLPGHKTLVGGLS